MADNHYSLTTVDQKTGKEGSWKVNVTSDTLLRFRGDKLFSISIQTIVEMMDKMVADSNTAMKSAYRRAYRHK